MVRVLGREIHVPLAGVAIVGVLDPDREVVCVRHPVDRRERLRRRRGSVHVRECRRDLVRRALRRRVALVVVVLHRARQARRKRVVLLLLLLLLAPAPGAGAAS